MKTEETWRTEEIWLPRGRQRIYTLLRIPEGQHLPVLIFSHGFGASHASCQRLQTALAAAGILTVSFDFCGGGGFAEYPSQSSGDRMQMSIQTEKEDLETVMDAVCRRPEADREQLYLSGESQGGLVASMVAAAQPARVRGLFLLYPAFNLAEYMRAHASFSDGVPQEASMLFGLKCGKKAVKDALAYDVWKECPKYAGPVVIWHGDCDKVVDLTVSQRMVSLYRQGTLHVVPEQGHFFTGKTCERIGQQMAAAILAAGKTIA